MSSQQSMYFLNGRYNPQYSEKRRAELRHAAGVICPAGRIGIAQAFSSLTLDIYEKYEETVAYNS